MKTIILYLKYLKKRQKLCENISELEKFRNQVIVENKYLKRQVTELKKELEKKIFLKQKQNQSNTQWIMF